MLKKRNQKGFTLIEIIAVLIILGILAAVAIPKFFDLQNDAKMANAQAGVGAIQSALSLGLAANLLAKTGAPATPTAACADAKLEPAAKYSQSCTATGTDTWADITSVAISVTYDGYTASGAWTK